MTPLWTLINTPRERERGEADRLKEERRKLVAPDEGSRPELARGGETLTLPEWLFLAPLYGVAGTVVGLVIAEGCASHGSSLLFDFAPGAALLLALALVSMALLFADVASYRPRLFALADSRGLDLIQAFVSQSGDFETIADEFRNTPLLRWAQMPRRQELVLSATNQYVRLGGLRLRIAVRTLLRLAALIGALALVAYALSALTGGDVMSSHRQDAGVAEHLYFVTTQFLTIGFGDLHPNHGAWGYAFMGLAAVTMAAVVYFVLAEIVASQAQFRNDLRAAVERYVLSNTQV